VTGLTNGTGYDFRVSAVNAIGTGTPSATVTGTPTTTPTIAPNDANLTYSPYNWNVTSTRALSINAGAYVRTIIQGTPTAITALFDTSALAGAAPEIRYRVDMGPWIRAAVADSVALTMPSDAAAWTKHVVEIVFAATNVTHERWAGTEAALRFRGFLTSPGSCTTEAIPARGLRVLVYGDSITEGIRTLAAADPPANHDATRCWPLLLADELGAEVGSVGFGGTGIVSAGAGNVPAWPSTWDKIYSGVNRSFTAQPDVIYVLLGQNDDMILGDITTAYTAVLNSLLTAAPSAKILCLSPLSGVRASDVQAAALAASDQTRVSYVNTAGWLISAGDTGDGGLHPYGYRNRQIAALVAAQVRGLMGEGGGVGTGATWLKQAGGSLKAIALAA
jgi:lysophospholipase L1-like esterase